MKKIKKVLVFLLVTVMAAAVFVGCGKEEKTTTPEESAKIFLDVVLKADKSNMGKIGLKEEDYKKFREELENGMMEGASSTGLDESILTSDVKNKFIENMIKGLAKVEYEVAPISSDDKVAKVEVKMKGFDMTKIQTAATEKLQADFVANPAMSEAEIFQGAFKYVGEAIAEGTLASEPKSVTLTLDKVEGVWVPNESDIVTLVTAVIAE